MSNTLTLITNEQMQQIKTAAIILKSGGVVAFPTETVYGLGADASNIPAIRRVYEMKGRPLNHPVIVHLGDISQLEDWASEVSDVARNLIDCFWPGPLTLIFRRTHRVLDEVTGGQSTVAIRMPSNAIAMTLLRELGHPLIAPSANRFGRTSPTQAEHVRQDLGGTIDFIIEGGGCEIGIESTILDVSGDIPQIARLGAITPNQLKNVIGFDILSLKKPSIRVPGDMASHYAPCTPLYIIENTDIESTALSLASNGKKVAVLTQQEPFFRNNQVVWFQLPLSPHEYIRVFYHYLFMADKEKTDAILIEAVAKEDAWLAVSDRMIRAAHANKHQQF